MRIWNEVTEVITTIRACKLDLPNDERSATNDVSRSLLKLVEHEVQNHSQKCVRQAR